MKGMQKSKFRPQAGGADVEITGFEVAPFTVVAGTLAFVVLVIASHFVTKLAGSGGAAPAS